MTRLMSVAAVTGAMLIFFSPAAFAEMANGSYGRDFSSSEVPLWDISGDYSDDTGIGTNTLTISEDASGALTGTGSFNATINVDDCLGSPGTIVLTSNSLNVIGKINGLSTAPRVSWKLSIAGTGTVCGEDVNFTATGNENFELDGVNTQLVLTGGKIQATFTDPTSGKKVGGGSQKISGGGTTDLPTDSTGDWTLDVTLNPVPDSTKYDGTTSTGTVETSTSGSADLTASGSYSSKTDTSKVTLKGEKGTGASLKLLISTTGVFMTVTGAKGKLYGQKITFTAPSP